MYLYFIKYFSFQKVNYKRVKQRGGEKWINKLKDWPIRISNQFINCYWRRTINGSNLILLLAIKEFEKNYESSSRIKQLCICLNQNSFKAI